MLSRFKIIRPINLIVIIVAHLLIYHHSFIREADDFLLLFSFSMACVLTAAAGYVINDLFDMKADAENRPNAPLVNESLTKGQAWIYYFFLLCASIFFANSCNIQIVYLVLGIHTGLGLYAMYLKRFPLIGNFVISIFTGLLFYAASFVLTSPHPIILELVMLSVAVSWVRELVKTAEDQKGDKVAGFRTIAVLKGASFTYKLAAISSFVFTLSWILYCNYQVFSSPVWYIGTIVLMLSLSGMGVRWMYAREKKFQYSTWVKVLMLICIVLGFYY
jgi:4-hydroxybenzoate polyprenyltransferase